MFSSSAQSSSVQGQFKGSRVCSGILSRVLRGRLIVQGLFECSGAVRVFRGCWSVQGQRLFECSGAVQVFRGSSGVQGRFGCSGAVQVFRGSSGVQGQ